MCATAACAASSPGPAREIAQLQALELLQDEHDLLKKAFGSVPLEGRLRRAEQDRALSVEIASLFAAHRERYGSPRLYRVLLDAGWVGSPPRVAR